MKISRLGLLRVLEKVKSTGCNELCLGRDGKFVVGSNDGAVVLKGDTGMTFGKDLGFMDVDMLMKMLRKLKAPEIWFELKGFHLTLREDNLQFGYRLAEPDLVLTVSEDVLNVLESTEFGQVDLYVDDAKKILDLAKALGVDKVTFKNEEGRLVSIVGDEKMFYGRLLFGADVSGFDRYDFLCLHLLPVLDELDESSVRFSFSLGDRKLLKVESGDYVWYVGALVEEEV